LNRPYDFSADVFSAGVVLFILLTGYPPFEQAHKTDKWFRPLAKEDYNKFWELHSGCQISTDADVKDLLQKMLTYNPKHRISIADIKKHKWFNAKSLEGKDLVKALRGRYRQMESKRRKDAKKLSDLQDSNHNRGTQIPVEGLADHEAEIPLYPEGEMEGIYDTHTTAKWKDIYNAVNTVVCEIAGHTVYDFSEDFLLCSVKLQGPHPSGESLVRFQVQVFRSREFADGPAYEDSDREEDTNVQNEKIYVVRFRRLEGDVLDWRKILHQVIYKKCSGVLTGLPKWARDGLDKVDSANVEDDNYENFLSAEGAGF
jgi:serine/threonine protein kinase